MVMCRCIVALIIIAHYRGRLGTKPQLNDITNEMISIFEAIIALVANPIPKVFETIQSCPAARVIPVPLSEILHAGPGISVRRMHIVADAPIYPNPFLPL